MGGTQSLTVVWLLEPGHLAQLELAMQRRLVISRSGAAEYLSLGQWSTGSPRMLLTGEDYIIGSVHSVPVQ